jgi:hypothetical protein
MNYLCRKVDQHYVMYNSTVLYTLDRSQPRWSCGVGSSLSMGREVHGSISRFPVMRFSSRASLVWSFGRYIADNAVLFYGVDM